MQEFQYKNNTLYCENIVISELIDKYQSPLYVYSKATIVNNYSQFSKAFKNSNHLICYSVKANSNISVLNVLAILGSGFDVVSIGELERVKIAGGNMAKCVFSGIGKSNYEIQKALELGILCFNIESKSELLRVQNIAKQINKIANISIRINPDIDAKTHPYIATGLKDNKFGIDVNDAPSLYNDANKLSHINITGIDCHIGSQITEIKPFLDALNRILALIKQLENNNIRISHIDLGGGVGIKYTKDDKQIDINEYISKILAKTKGYKIILEPGRAITGNAGIFVTKIEFLKQTKTKSFAIVDGAMNDLLRVALYNSYHKIIPVSPRNNGIQNNWDIVGPVCETGDFLGQNRKLNLLEGDYLAVTSAGAYCFVMASNYNSRPRVAEVMVVDNKHYLISKRETIQDIIKQEQLIPE